MLQGSGAQPWRMPPIPSGAALEHLWPLLGWPGYWYRNLAVEQVKGAHSPMHVGHQQPVGLDGILSKHEKSDHKCKEIQTFQDIM